MSFVNVFLAVCVVGIIYMGLKVLGISPSKVWKAGVGAIKSLFKKG